MGRYASIKQVSNINLLKMQILICDVDWFTLQETQIVNLSESLSYCDFVYFQPTNYRFEVLDAKFTITRDDDHKADWLQSRHIDKDAWQITITVHDDTTMRVAFWQTKNSKQLYMYLLENRNL